MDDETSSIVGMQSEFREVIPGAGLDRASALQARWGSHTHPQSGLSSATLRLLQYSLLFGESDIVLQKLFPNYVVDLSTSDAAFLDMLMINVLFHNAWSQHVYTDRLSYCYRR